MALSFPDQSRSFDATRRAVQFAKRAAGGRVLARCIKGSSPNFRTRPQLRRHTYKGLTIEQSRPPELAASS